MKDFIRENKLQIAGGLAFVGFTTLLFRTRGIQARELSRFQAMQSYNPRVIAYAFASKALMYSTGLVGLGGIMIGIGSAIALDVDNFKDYTVALRRTIHEHFPWIRVAKEGYVDDGVEAFMQEWNMVSKDEYKETPPHEFIGYTIRSNLGPMARKQD